MDKKTVDEYEQWYKKAKQEYMKGVKECLDFNFIINEYFDKIKNIKIELNKDGEFETSLEQVRDIIKNINIQFENEMRVKCGNIYPQLQMLNAEWFGEQAHWRKETLGWK